MYTSIFSSISIEVFLPHTVHNPHDFLVSSWYEIGIDPHGKPIVGVQIFTSKLLESFLSLISLPHFFEHTPIKILFTLFWKNALDKDTSDFHFAKYNKYNS